jgi:hypothetical protein
MAKKKTGTEVAVNEPAGAVAIVGAAQLPAYLKDFRGPTGTEGIQSEDITLPRLKIGQDMNPEVQEGDVERGDLFLNLTGEIVNPAGERLPFAVLGQNKEYILWRPKKDNGGGILARAKPVQTPDGVRYAWDKPNETFEVKVEGRIAVTWATKEYIDEDGLSEWGSEIPGDASSGIAATAHHNYVVILPTVGDSIAALSLSRTAASKAKDFNGMLKIGNGPLQARLYTVETVDQEKDSHKFKNYKFRPAGYGTEEQYNKYAALAASFKGKTINVDQSDNDQGSEKDERA